MCMGCRNVAGYVCHIRIYDCRHNSCYLLDNSWINQDSFRRDDNRRYIWRVAAIALFYSQKFRHKYNYTGYVWQGRFKSNLIEEDSYILQCIEYIHNNPVRAGMVEDPEDYPWSSYNFVILGTQYLIHEK